MNRAKEYIYDFDQKVVSFAGIEHGDIIYYVSKLFAGEKRSVLVIDNSGRHDLMRVIQPDGNGGRFVNEKRYAGSIVYCADTAYSPDAFDRFDTVIVYHGMDIDPDLWEASDVKFVMTDTDKLDREDVKGMMKQIKEAGWEYSPAADKVWILILDAYYNKIKARDIVSDITDDPDHVSGILELGFDPANISSKQTWEYNGMQQIISLPDSIKELLLELYEAIEEKKPDKPKKLLKDAK